MKKVIFISVTVLLVFVSVICMAQQPAKTEKSATTKYQVENNVITQVGADKQPHDSTTQYQFKNSKNELVPVYKTKNGKLYVCRISKNGNYYRQYINIEN